MPPGETSGDAEEADVEVLMSMRTSRSAMLRSWSTIERRGRGAERRQRHRRVGGGEDVLVADGERGGVAVVVASPRMPSASWFIALPARSVSVGPSTSCVAAVGDLRREGDVELAVERAGHDGDAGDGDGAVGAGEADDVAGVKLAGSIGSLKITRSVLTMPPTPPDGSVPTTRGPSVSLTARAALSRPRGDRAAVQARQVIDRVQHLVDDLR